MIELMVQELGQVEIPESQRSTFAGTEQSFHSLFALCHWAATVVWSHPGQFRWLALGSLLVVGAGVVIFGSWMRKERSTGAKRRGEYEEIAMGDVGREREDDG
jgi:solute carrier family 40 (iron-regulated transporter), member 1